MTYLVYHNRDARLPLLSRRVPDPAPGSSVASRGLREAVSPPRAAPCHAAPKMQNSRAAKIESWQPGCVDAAAPLQPDHPFRRGSLFVGCRTIECMKHVALSIQTAVDEADSRKRPPPPSPPVWDVEPSEARARPREPWRAGWQAAHCPGRSGLFALVQAVDEVRHLSGREPVVVAHRGHVQGRDGVCVGNLLAQMRAGKGGSRSWHGGSSGLALAHVSAVLHQAPHRPGDPFATRQKNRTSRNRGVPSGARRDRSTEPQDGRGGRRWN